MHVNRPLSRVATAVCLTLAAVHAGDLDVVINEINYHPIPAGTLEPNQLTWIELFNRSAQPVDLSHWSFSEGIRFVFPAGATLPGRSFLVVARDRAAFESVWGSIPVVGDFGPNLKGGGQRIILTDAIGFIVDSVFFDDQAPWPESAGGYGATLELVDPEADNDDRQCWAASRFVGGTPGRKNSRARIAADPVPPNVLWRFWRGMEDPPGAYGAWTEPGYDDGLWERGVCPIGHGSGGELPLTILDDMPGAYTTAFLRYPFDVPDPAAVGELILSVDFSDGFIAYVNGAEVARFHMDGGHPRHTARATSSRRSGLPSVWPVSPDLLRPGENVLAVAAAKRDLGSGGFVIAAALTGIARVRSEPPARLTITEVGHTDGRFFVELRNDETSPLSLRDYRLGTDLSALAANVLDGDLAAGASTAVMYDRLPLSGVMVLARGDALEVVDGLRFHLSNGASWGFPPRALSRATVLSAATPGAPNAAPAGWPIVISELNYHPPSNDVRDEFVELFNAGDLPVDLTAWRFTAGISYVFPQGMILDPQQYLLVVADVRYAADRYPAARIVGDFRGRLSNSGERVRLENADGVPVVDFRYADDGSWPRQADGNAEPRHAGDPGGQSMTLELVHPAFDPAFGGSWAAESVHGTPGGPRDNGAWDDPPPVVYELGFDPPLPAPGQAVRFTAVVDSVTPIARVDLRWRYDSADQWDTLSLADDGLNGDGAAGDGRWGGFAAGFDQVGTVLFYLEVESQTGALGVWPRSAPGAPFLMRVDDRPFPDSSAVPFYYIIMAQQDLTGASGLRTRSSRSDVLLPCALLRNGRVHQYGQVRYRGNSARNPPAPWTYSYRVELTNDAMQPEARILYLNGVAPHSQFVGMATFRRAGIPAPRATLVSLAMNDGFWAQHVHVERLDGAWLRYAMPHDAEGNLYRGERCGQGDGDLVYRTQPAHYPCAYIKMTHQEEADWSDIINLTQVLARRDDGYLEAVHEVLDADQWARYFAVHTILSNQENSIYRQSGDDYFIYARGADGRFILLPWDMDSVFEAADERLFRPELAPIRYLLRHPAIAPRYWYHLQELIDRTFTAEAVGRDLAALSRGVSGRYVAGMAAYRTRRAEFVLRQLPTELSACASVLDGSAPTEDLIPWGAAWHYLRGLEDPSPDNEWTELGFDDTSWESGPAGFGYGDDDDATVLDDMRGNYTVVFIRRSFTLAAAGDLAFYRLWVDFDDGFAAYLNGVEIARENAGAPGTVIRVDAVATASHEAGDPMSYDMAAHIGAARAGENVLAVAGLNNRALSSDFSLHPALLAKGGGADSGVPGGCGSPVYVPQGGNVHLSGLAPVTAASGVAVDGTGASYDVMTGAWSVTLEGVGEDIFIEALDYDGHPVETLTLAVVHAQSSVLSGSISTDRTLTRAGGPYLVQAATVEAGAVLTVEAGSELLMGPGAGLTVAGELSVDGTAAEGVHFRRGRQGADPLIRVTSGAATVRHATFDDGTSPDGAVAWGAACVVQGGSLRLEDCTFQRIPFHAVTVEDGSLAVTNTIFSDSAGGIMLTGGQAEIRASRFERLSVGDAIRQLGGGRCTVTECTFLDLARHGIDSEGETTVTDLRFIGCAGTALRFSGAASGRVEKTLVARAETGIAVLSGASAVLDHLTLVDNGMALAVDSAGGGATGVQLENSIVWDNRLGFSSGGLAALGVAFTLVQEEAFSGSNGTFLDDPRFVDPVAGDWRLAAGSPAIGRARHGGDLGAFSPAGTEHVPGDINRDGLTNIADVIFLLAYLFAGGQELPCPAVANTNGDEAIDVSDAVYLLAYLFADGADPAPLPGPCPE